MKPLLIRYMLLLLLAQPWLLSCSAQPNEKLKPMLSEQEKEEIKQRLLSKFNLQKIILFGSQARGTSDNKSDVDLLIISELNEDRFNLMDRMRVCLMQLNYAFDVIILTENEFERDKKYPGTVARYATKEGIVLYEQ